MALLILSYLVFVYLRFYKPGEKITQEIKSNPTPGAVWEEPVWKWAKKDKDGKLMRYKYGGRIALTKETVILKSNSLTIFTIPINNFDMELIGGMAGAYIKQDSTLWRVQLYPRFGWFADAETGKKFVQLEQKLKEMTAIRQLAGQLADWGQLADCPLTGMGIAN